MELDRSVVEGVNKANKKLGEFFYLIANEPSVGLYHVQEHIRKTIPKNTEVKREIRKKYQTIEAMTYDVNFSIQTVKSLHDLTTFTSIKQTMDSCIEMLHTLNKTQQARKRAPSTPKSVATPAPTPQSTSTPALPALRDIPPTSLPPTTPKPDSPRPHSDDSSVPTDSESSSESIGEKNAPASNEPESNTSDNEHDNGSSAVDSSLATDNGEATPKKNRKAKKPKAVKSLSKNFDLTPKQF